MGEPLREIVTEALLLLASRSPVLLGLAAVVLAAVGAESLLQRGLGGSARRRARAALLAAGAGVGLWLAWGVLWLADDAFISFRYARNFARGLGLVFNEGEWVEGYTNFLWTALLGVLGRLGVDIPTAGLFGCLLCFVLALIVVAATVRRIAGGVVPFAALALAGLAPFLTFASSGLETMPLALLAALAVWASTRRRGALLAGLVCVLAALTRPDFLLVWGCMGLALLVEDLAFADGPLGRRISVGRLASFAAPLVLVYVPYFLVRWSAYGDLLPNTFYAKSGGLTYLRQGGVYLVHFLFTTGGWLWMPLLALSLVGRPRARDELRLRVFAGLCLVVYGAYVVKVGGDFMEHRFFVPLLPIAAMAIEVGLRHRLREASTAAKEALVLAPAVVTAAVSLVPVRLVGEGKKRWHIAAEHTFYPVAQVFPLRVESVYAEQGRLLHRVFAEKGFRPRFVGDAIGMVGYYSDLPIVDALGLTNRYIAHKPVRHRGRPGHEKFGTPEELQREGAQLSPWPLWGESWRRQTEVRLDGASFFLARIDPPLVAALEELGAEVPNPGKQIAALIREGPRDEVLAAVHFYRSFLEGRRDRDALVFLLETRLAAIADFEDGFPEGTWVSGPNMRVLRGRPPLGGSGAGWLSSYGRGEGRVEIPVPRIESGEIRFALGGAAAPGLAVRLRVDGEVVREAAPQGGNRLAPVSWDVSEFRGEPAVIAIEDKDPSPDLGIVVDGIHFAASGEGDVRTRIARWSREGRGDAATLLREAERYLPPEDSDAALLQAEVEERWSLDEGLPAGSVVTGEAFGRAPVFGALCRQQPLSGWQGRALLNSFHGGDRAVGRVALPERILSGGPIALLVGGGGDCGQTFVGLEVEGEIVARVCGRNDEVLRPEVLATKEWAGKAGRVVVVDRSKDVWGHVLADDVIFLRPR
ncbi:MAG TPA: hypothetical protein VN033_08675 [Vulgatibacter sp.]|nr:hypothetical protein [Vulgatibacter sp.]